MHGRAACRDAEARRSGAGSAAATPIRAPRRARAADTALDAETLIRGVFAKIQGQGNVEAERLREGLRKAIAVLQAKLGA